MPNNVKTPELTVTQELEFAALHDKFNNMKASNSPYLKEMVAAMIMCLAIEGIDAGKLKLVKDTIDHIYQRGMLDGMKFLSDAQTAQKIAKASDGNVFES